jgi:hypothetical protein
MFLQSGYAKNSDLADVLDAREEDMKKAARTLFLVRVSH